MLKSPPTESETGATTVPLSMVKLWEVEAFAPRVKVAPKPLKVSLLKIELPVMVPESVAEVVEDIFTSPELWVNVPEFE